MRRQKRHNRSRLIISLSIIGVLIVIVGAFLLIRRAPDVSGPAESSSKVSSTTKFSAGTYTASGSVTDSTDNLRQLFVWIKLSKNKTFTRLLIYDRDTTPVVVNDSGTFTQSGDRLNLKSHEANVYAYANPTAYSDKTPNSITKYDGTADGDEGYPDSIADVLNDYITLDSHTPETYYYLKSKLPLKSSSFDVSSLSDFAEGQEQTPKLSSSSSPFSVSESESSVETESSTSSSSSEASSGFVPTAAMIQIARQQLRDIGVNDSQWSDAQISAAIIESANRGGDSVVPILVPDYQGNDNSNDGGNNSANVGTGKIKYVDQAYAILLQKYPATQYAAEQTGMTSDGSGFIFSVRNRETGETISVTITGDGEIQG